MEREYIKQTIMFRSAACRACRRNMEEELFQAYSRQFDEQTQQANFEISQMAMDIIFRTAALAIARMDGKAGHDLYPYLEELDKILGVGKVIGDYEEELFRETGLMVTTTEDGWTNFGTREDYIKAGWDWPEELDGREEE